MFCSVHDFTFLMTDTKIKGQVSFEPLEKKKLACAIFDKICYVACAINRAGKLICMRACLHERDRAGLIDKPEVFNRRFGFKMKDCYVLYYFMAGNRPNFQDQIRKFTSFLSKFVCLFSKPVDDS